MEKLELSEIETRCQEFVKYVFDNYANAHQITKFLEQEFEKKGLMCGFNWIPNHEYHGEIRVVFIFISDKFKINKRIATRLKGPITKTMPLQNFIYDYYNPEGVYLLEKIRFQLGG